MAAMARRHGVLTGIRRLRAGGLALLCLGCADDAPHGEASNDTWVTEPEYKFTGTPEQGVVFSWIGRLLVDPDRNRVFVSDAREVQVSAWRPEGSLVFAVGRQGPGPGEFMAPSQIYLAEDGGFTVREGWGSRFTHYAPDGALVRTEPGAPTSVTYNDFRVGLEAPTGTGSYFGTTLIGIGLPDDPNLKIEREPLLRVDRSDDGRWLAPEPIFWNNIRNRRHVVEFGDGMSVGGQVFGDSDHNAFRDGRALVMRQAGGAPGSVELVEVNAEGDTVWLRDLQLQPLKLTPERIGEAFEEFAPPRSASSGDSPPGLREAWEASLYKPAYLPAAQGFFLAASDDVWIRTFERSDTLIAYYSVRSGDVLVAPRRVLVPESLRVFDATDTHVWGIWEDPLGVPYIVGRRLRRGDAE